MAATNSPSVATSPTTKTQESPKPSSTLEWCQPTRVSYDEEHPQSLCLIQETQPQYAPLSGPQPNDTPSQVSTSSPPKVTPIKSTLKALPTVRDHTTDQLGPSGDEYLPRQIDESGEKKVMPNGQLLGGRQYRCRTFLVPNRGDKLFMLATECARVLGYRDSYLLFNKNRSLFKIIANQTEKNNLVSQEILPLSYRSRQIAIVTARSMFRQFSSRVILNGRRVRDDYWETRARKQGFTEADLAGEKRPGASKAREAAAAEKNASLLGDSQGEIVYSNNAAQFGDAPPPHPIPQGINMWPRPHEQPWSAALTQAVSVGTADASIPMSRATQSTLAGTPRQHTGLVSTRIFKPMMTAPPYSAPIQAQHPISQSSTTRGMARVPSQPQSEPRSLSLGSTASMPQTAQAYGYQPSSQTWPPTPQPPQCVYTHNQQAQQVPHPPQSSMSQMRHSSTSGLVQQGGMPYSGMPGMAQGYPAPSPYDHETPGQYMRQASTVSPAVTQAWLGQQQQPQW